MTTDPTELDAVAKAAEIIARSDGLIVAAGAGMGADSGLPDFRGSDGFWRAYPALGRARLSFQEVASPATFIRDPALAWGFYGHRLKLYRETVPHAGFGILQRWAEGMKHGGFVFTSNVDGQFQKAGLRLRLSSSATGPSTFCNARPFAALQRGWRATSIRSLMKPPADGRDRCRFAQAAERLLDPTS